MNQPASNLWGLETGDTRPGGDHYVALVTGLRDLQDAVVCANASPEVVDAALAVMREAELLLEPDAVVPGRHHAGLRADVPGRGHPLAVPIEILEWDSDSVRGRVLFTPFFLGGGTAVHGGATALMFDELLGRLTNNGPPSRTASLTIDYRKVVPVGRSLPCEAHVVRREGRKMFVRGHVSDDDGTVLAEAEGLWIELRSDASAGERGVLE